MQQYFKQFFHDNGIRMPDTAWLNVSLDDLQLFPSNHEITCTHPHGNKEDHPYLHVNTPPLLQPQSPPPPPHVRMHAYEERIGETDSSSFAASPEHDELAVYQAAQDAMADFMSPRCRHLRMNSSNSEACFDRVHHGIKVIKVTSTGGYKQRFLTISLDRCALFVTHEPIYKVGQGEGLDSVHGSMLKLPMFANGIPTKTQRWRKWLRGALTVSSVRENKYCC